MGFTSILFKTIYICHSLIVANGNPLIVADMSLKKNQVTLFFLKENNFIDSNQQYI